MATSTDYLGQRVEAVKETANGLYVLLSLNGKKIGWIDKKALGDFSYRSQAQNISGGTVVSYSPTIAKAGFSVDTLPWGYPGYQWRTSTDSYVGQQVDAIKESADGHYVLISLNGSYIGWVDKAALSGLPTYAKGSGLDSDQRVFPQQLGSQLLHWQQLYHRQLEPTKRLGL